MILFLWMVHMYTQAFLECFYSIFIIYSINTYFCLSGFNNQKEDGFS
jgi:hypothetical protein